MNPLHEIFIESLEQNHPILYGFIKTRAIRTVEQFAGVKLTAWAYKLYKNEYICTRS